MSNDGNNRLYANDFLINKKRHPIKLNPDYGDGRKTVYIKDVPTYLDKYNGVVKEFNSTHSYKVSVDTLWIDKVLDIHSINPVQNCTVTSALCDLWDSLNDLSTDTIDQINNLSVFLSLDYSSKISTSVTNIYNNLSINVENIYGSLSFISVDVYEEIRNLSISLYNEIYNLCSYVEQLQNVLVISSYNSSEYDYEIPLTKKVHVYEIIDDFVRGVFPKFKAPSDIVADQITSYGYMFEFEVEWKTSAAHISFPSSTDQIRYVWMNQFELIDDLQEHTYFFKGRFDSRTNEIILFCWRAI